MLDPHALAIGNTDSWRGALREANSVQELLPGKRPPRAALNAAKGLLINRSFDWQGVERPKRPWSETIIYEAHVRGLTIHPASAAKYPGTFLGVVDTIPYFKDLGITAVELMPVQEFDEGDAARTDPTTGEMLCNYWGYNTVAFFAPKESYSTRTRSGCQVDELKTMVRELHRAGIEIILDVAFNHTAEGGESGPTFNFRGLDNSIYYMLDERGQYLDFTGCANTLNCGHTVVRDYIIECLRYWATEMHVDGFRFDLASVLGRDLKGNLMSNPPLIERIAEDPILGDLKLIAEAWDAGGAFQVGSFPSERWLEWNSRFRDDVRRFWLGDRGMRGAFASRVCGSADLYQKADSSPIRSINFVTCHDGFTLNDVVGYSSKHNEANGLGNRDGATGEISFNHGVEGETDDPEIERVRLRQIKNMLATLMISRGIPMLLGGDEFRRTQKGNNNAYCQDNETSWYDWRLLERNKEVLQFTRTLIQIRREFPALRADRYYRDAEVEWFDCDGKPIKWQSPDQSLGMLIKVNTPEANRDAEPVLCLLFNAGAQSIKFALPQFALGARWRMVFDTYSQGEASEAVRALRELSDQKHYELAGVAMAMLAPN